MVLFQLNFYLIGSFEVNPNTFKPLSPSGMSWKLTDFRAQVDLPEDGIQVGNNFSLYWTENGLGNFKGLSYRTFFTTNWQEGAQE